MRNIKKQEYYLSHKEKRLTYQKKYYVNNKDKIKRRRELRRAADPEWAEAQKVYNREYYLKNREQIKARRSKKVPLAD
jgi:hypothetical protein|tara:strand:+ start:317 stop:550 length:234 start_codon:yes stop_codon:yes gene_type:complete